MMTAEDQLLRDQVDQTHQLEPTGAVADQSVKEGKRKVIWIQSIVFLLGIVLLIYVLKRVGLQPIFDALGRIGFGFFLLLSISGMRHILRTIAMSIAVPREHRRFNIFQALSARLGGEAISFLTFTGPLLGEATKVALLRKRVPLAHGVPALVVDNILYNLSVSLFILSGACVMLAAYSLPRFIQSLLIGIAVASAFCILAVTLAVNRRIMPLTWIIGKLSNSRLNIKILDTKRDHLLQLESNVYDFYRNRRGAFFAMFGFNFLAHVSSVLEVYMALHLLGLTASVNAAYVIESLTKVIKFVFSFVPATIGVYEGGTEVILRTLGFVSATGVTLAIVRKAGDIFWASIGLLILIKRAVPNAANHLIERNPRLRKFMENLVIANIMHRPARTLTSILGVALGVVLIVLTVGLANGLLRERAKREANMGAEIMVRASGVVGLGGSQPFSLPLSRVEALSRIEGVKAAVPIGQNMVSSDTGFGGRLVDGIPFEEYASISGLQIIEGNKLTSGDVAIVDSVWIRERKAQVGSTVTLYDRPFRIVGVYDPPGGGRIKVPLATMQEQLGGEGHCSSVLVAATDPAKQEEVAAKIREQFPEDQIIFTKDLQELYTTSVPALNIFIKVVVAIAATISMLVILLAMYTSVMERTRQIGILKSLGMSNTLIALTIEQEALAVSFIGFLVGVLLTFAARFAIMQTTSLTIDIEMHWLLISLGIGLIGGTIGALYPAIRAARQDAVNALSYE
jgi:putative ABC transport system permease protein